MRNPAESYGSIININKAGPVLVSPAELVIQEKVDGSQFRFQEVMNETDTNSVLLCWSRGNRLSLDSPPAMFALAVGTVVKLHQEKKLLPGAVYIAEAVTSRRHNVINYERIPTGGLVLLDVYAAPDGWMGAEFVKFHGEQLGLEVAPYKGSIAPGQVVDIATLIAQSAAEVSLLGGPVEGLVVKSFANQVNRFGESWKWKVINPSFSETKSQPKAPQADWVAVLGSSLANPIKWQKALMRLTEQGLTNGTSRDIGVLVKLVQADVDKEDREELLLEAWSRLRKTVLANSVKGLAEWYQGQLLQGQTTSTTDSATEPASESTSTSSEATPLPSTPELATV